MSGSSLLTQIEHVSIVLSNLCLWLLASGCSCPVCKLPNMKRQSLELPQAGAAGHHHEDEDFEAGESTCLAPSLKVCHHKVGSAEWLQAMEELEPGADSISDLLAWPTALGKCLWGSQASGAVVHTAFAEQSHRRLCCLQRLTDKGLEIMTDFSGVGSPEQALLEMCQVAQVPPPHYYRACDVDPACQQVLIAPHPARAEHVFQDILDRLPPKAQQRLSTSRSAESVEGNAFIQKYLHRRKAFCFAGFNARSAGCLIHRGHQCMPQSCWSLVYMVVHVCVASVLRAQGCNAVVRNHESRSFNHKLLLDARELRAGDRAQE